MPGDYLTVNPDVSITKWEAHKKYLVENRGCGSLFAVGEVEHLVLNLFDGTRDFSAICEEIKKHGLQIEEDILRGFILTARRDNILVERSGLTTKAGMSRNHRLRLLQKITVPFLRMPALSRVRFEFAGNRRILRILSIDLANLRIDRFAMCLRNQRRTAVIAGIGILLYFIAGISFLGMHAHEVFSNYVLPSEDASTYVISFLTISLFLGAFHELGHFMVYKYYGGDGSQLGFGLLFCIVPLFYVDINGSYLFKTRKERIMTLAGGPLVDAFFLVLSLLVLLAAGNPFVLTISSVVFAASLVKIALNVNPFLPGTDPYFLLCEILGTYNLSVKSLDKLKSKFARYPSAVCRGTGSVYYIFAVLMLFSIVIQWCIVIVFFYLPLLYLLLGLFSVKPI